ncbi:DUF551 domain-containing protein [Salmonella enterica]|nr:DUF551 domain-containing protein [Salmonella enterica]ELC3970935.1 DUF551 domain-containing protein [Salmonella enterica]ELE9048719.1 DUF551 domain-containing protein [Salmonella enterica]ELF3792882.1 DUF551 domain-containing protein [Salmonella enterica]
MKENQIQELVNDLRDIAVEYHGTQQLRERIARTVRAAWHHDLEKPNQPVSQTYELPQTQFEQVADLYEMQFDDGRTCAFHTDGTKAAQWLLACDGNKVQEYVRIERYQEAVIGNSPVQSPIDHGYRPECECSGCKATARICAELNNEEAEIFADGYNAAMLKVNKNASTELPNDANLSTSSQAEPDDSGLLPCPFCGSPAEHYPDGDMEGYIIMCGNKNGDCNLQTFGFTTPEEAEKAWNTRAAIPQTGNFRENPISSTNNFRKIADTSTNSPVTQDGWISCSERMPNDKDYVWCWGKSYGWTECDTFEGYYDWSRNKWWAVTDDVEEPASKVTHWMPLPEPPQQEVK